ncbi:hypothetical protein [Arthrobacter sp. 35W]|nr:hypothetical protein [Arthrobacter sp. 35W]
MDTRRPAHAPAVGVLISGDKNDPTAQYALGRSTASMAVAT